MRENRPYGSEGGEAQSLPDPYHHEAKLPAHPREGGDPVIS